MLPIFIELPGWAHLSGSCWLSLISISQAPIENPLHMGFHVRVFAGTGAYKVYVGLLYSAQGEL